MPRETFSHGRDLGADRVEVGEDPVDGVAAERQAQRRRLGGERRADRGGGLRRVAGLGAVAALDEAPGRAGGLGVGRVLRAHHGRTRAEQVGAEGAGLDDHDLDPERRHLGGQRLGHGLQRELRRAVDAEPGHDDLAADTAHHHDRPAAALAHVRQHRAGERERAEHVQVEQGAQLVVRGLLDGADLGAAGVVDQHVDPAVPVDGASATAASRPAVGDVERDGVDRPGWAATRSSSAAGLRTAATTVSPASAAASVIARPKPLLAPVTNHTWGSVMGTPHCGRTSAARAAAAATCGSDGGTHCGDARPGLPGSARGAIGDGYGRSGGEHQPVERLRRCASG